MSTTGRVVAGWVTGILSGQRAVVVTDGGTAVSRPSVGELVNDFTKVRDPDGAR